MMFNPTSVTDNVMCLRYCCCRKTLFHYVNADVCPLLLTAAELQSILEPFLLRRVKSEVAVDLPKKTELVVYHGMSALQKKYYKAILMKDLGKTFAPWRAVVNLCRMLLFRIHIY